MSYQRIYYSSFVTWTSAHY